MSLYRTENQKFVYYVWNLRKNNYAGINDDKKKEIEEEYKIKFVAWYREIIANLKKNQEKRKMLTHAKIGME